MTTQNTNTVRFLPSSRYPKGEWFAIADGKAYPFGDDDFGKELAEWSQPRIASRKDMCMEDKAVSATLQLVTVWTFTNDNDNGLETYAYGSQGEACEMMYSAIEAGKYGADTAALRAHLDAGQFEDFNELAQAEIEESETGDNLRVESHEITLPLSAVRQGE